MVLFSFLVTEEKFCNIYKMEVRLAVSCPNFQVKYEQKSKSKDSVLWTLAFDIKRYLCARSKHKPKMNSGGRSALGQ